MSTSVSPEVRIPKKGAAVLLCCGHNCHHGTQNLLDSVHALERRHGLGASSVVGRGGDVADLILELVGSLPE